MIIILIKCMHALMDTLMELFLNIYQKIYHHRYSIISYTKLILFKLLMKCFKTQIIIYLNNWKTKKILVPPHYSY